MLRTPSSSRPLHLRLLLRAAPRLGPRRGRLFQGAAGASPHQVPKPGSGNGGKEPQREEVLPSGLPPISGGVVWGRLYFSLVTWPAVPSQLEGP